MEKFLILVDIFLDIAYNGRPQEHPGMTQVWILQLSVSGEVWWQDLADTSEDQTENLLSLE